MGWSSSIVSPPGGNMAAYVASLQLLLGRDDAIYLPGHGPLIRDPHPYVQSLLDHRIAREQAIAREIARAPCNTVGLVEALYSKIDPLLKLAAERNVLAHLQKLQTEGRALQDGGLWRAA
jgi:glyoxylase-like metal-dependent hydrolase (beta-lactamase superfamily II)